MCTLGLNVDNFNITGRNLCASILSNYYYIMYTATENIKMTCNRSIKN